MTKFCKDCKHYSQRFLAGKPVCMLVTEEVNLVYGYKLYQECSAARLAYNSCGPEGKNFEPKKPLTPPPTSETIKTRSYDWFKTFWK